MGKYIFNPFTQNFTAIPKPQPDGFFLLAARNGKLEWVEREDPMARTVTIGFTSTATREVSSVGILPRVVIARADAAYVKTIEAPGTYTHEVLIDDAASKTASYAVGVYLAPDQSAAITSLPSTEIAATPVADSDGNNIAFIYVATFTGDASVNINAYDSP
jgi:hypothetical protein